MTPAARSSFLALGIVFVSTSCLQLDQTLPLDLEDGQVAARSIGSEGGVVSVPPDFSMAVPAGALASCQLRSIDSERWLRSFSSSGFRRCGGAGWHHGGGIVE
jgi:hypothetical protein